MWTLSAVCRPAGGAELSRLGWAGCQVLTSTSWVVIHPLPLPPPRVCSRARSGDASGHRAPGTDQLEPWLRSLRVSTGGQREGGQAPRPRRRSPRFPACPAEAETRQRLLRTVKKEVGAATPRVTGPPRAPGCRWLCMANQGGGERGGRWKTGVSVRGALRCRNGRCLGGTWWRGRFSFLG